MLKQCYADPYKQWVHVGMFDIFSHTHKEKNENLLL